MLEIALKKGRHSKGPPGIGVLFMLIMLLSFVDRVKWATHQQFKFAYATVKCSCELCREK